MVIIAVLGVLAGKLLLEHRQEVAEAGAQEEQVPEQHRTDGDFRGQTYGIQQRADRYPVYGVDKKEEVTLQDTPGTAGQADCIMILSLDEEDADGKKYCRSPGIP